MARLYLPPICQTGRKGPPLFTPYMPGWKKGPASIYPLYARLEERAHLYLPPICQAGRKGPPLFTPICQAGRQSIIILSQTGVIRWSCRQGSYLHQRWKPNYYNYWEMCWFWPLCVNIKTQRLTLSISNFNLLLLAWINIYSWTCASILRYKRSTHTGLVG